jgi:hypothetical protein
MSRIVTVTAMWLDKLRYDYYSDSNKPVAYIKGKYFYIWTDGVLGKYRFLGYCIDKFAFRIATVKHDSWSK